MARTLSALLSTRRGVFSVALTLAALYALLLRPSAIAAPSSAPDSLTERQRQTWVDLRGGNPVLVSGNEGQAGGSGASSGTATTTVRFEDPLLKGKEAGQLPEEKVEVEQLQPGQQDEEQDKVAGAKKGKAVDEMFLHVGKDAQESGGRKAQPVKERKTRPRPFGQKESSAQDSTSEEEQATRDDGLLSAAELDSLDAEAEAERLAASSHSSHSLSSSVQAFSNDSLLSDPNEDNLSPSRQLNSNGNMYDGNDDDDDDDDDTFSPSPPLLLEEEGLANEGFSPEEEAEADAPSLAAKDDASLRAPMAALSNEGETEERRSVGHGAGKDSHAAAKAQGDSTSPATYDYENPRTSAQDQDDTVPAIAPAVVAGGKQVGTGGKLLAGAGSGGGAGSAGKGQAGGLVQQRLKKKPQQQRVGAGEKAGKVVKEEAGRRVGTGARPGAKGMGVARVRWRAM
ncbi:hypothetical protein JCM11641_004131 [Rhodosporidiobolus odoratus]